MLKLWLIQLALTDSQLFYTGVFSGLYKIVKFENLWALYKGNGAQMVMFTQVDQYKYV